MSPQLEARLSLLFSELPPDRAMGSLLPKSPAPIDEALREWIEMFEPEIAAGLWLYVDDLERSHVASQGIDDPTGSAWHAIMHRREGDFWNSKYWWRRAGDHPALVGWDGAALVDAVQAADGGDPANLVELQRAEWTRLMEWCLQEVVL